MRLEIQRSHWDGHTNPFSDIDQLLEEAEANTRSSACEKDHLTLYKHLAQDFERMFLNEHAFPRQDAPASQDVPRQAASVVIANEQQAWENFRRSVAQRCRNRKTKNEARPDSLHRGFQCQEHLLNLQNERLSFHTSWPGKVLVRLIAHPTFHRPFSAIGPLCHIFATTFSTSDWQDAARLVHECAHVEDALRRGWKAFQSSTPETLERFALTREHEYLETIFRRQNWPDSPERLAWITSFEHENLPKLASPDPEEVAEGLLYLKLVRQLSPEPSDPSS